MRIAAALIIVLPAALPLAAINQQAFAPVEKKLIEREAKVAQAQRIQHGALEFGQLIKDQHADMREADFARPHFQPAAGQHCYRGGMVRTAQRAGAADPALL